MEPNIENQKTSTRQRILESAAHLFAANGYTETTIRDIARFTNINSATIYHYFPNKDEILRSLIRDYGKATNLLSSRLEIPATLKDNPTVDGAVDCLQLDYNKLTQKYYKDILHFGHQEQYRNSFMRSLASKTIKSIEDRVTRVIDELKKQNVISQDADPDFWKKTASSLAHNAVCRTLLGIGETSEDYDGMGLHDLLRFMFGLLFKLYELPKDDFGNENG